MTYATVEKIRPISVLPVVSKVFEAALRIRLTKFLNGVLDAKQHGFREGESTISAVVNITNAIATVYDEYQKAQLTCCDLSKAFDCIKHGVLLEKLSVYGIRGIALSVFESYLRDRTQMVEWNSSRSSPAQVKFGVPQGSILGPFCLWCI